MIPNGHPDKFNGSSTNKKMSAEGLKMWTVSDDYFAEKMTEVYKAYEELCERESLVDFRELLLRVYILLKSNEEVLKHYQRRFSHILVDEFQDTNEVQYQFLNY